MNEGIDVLYDDRGEKAGFMFNDADLIGIPYRLIISPKSLMNHEVEFKYRDGSNTEMVAIDSLESYLMNLFNC